MKMHNPAHPGELLSGWVDDLDVSVTAFAAPEYQTGGGADALGGVVYIPIALMMLTVNHQTLTGVI